MFMIILFHSKIGNHAFPGKISMFTVIKVKKQRSKMRLWAIIFLNVLPKKNLLSYFFCRAQTLDHPEHKLLRKDFQKWDAQCWTQKCFPKSWKSIFLKFRNIFSFFFLIKNSTKPDRVQECLDNPLRYMTWLLGMVLCRDRSWTWWSLSWKVSSKSAYSVIL